MYQELLFAKRVKCIISFLVINIKLKSIQDASNMKIKVQNQKGVYKGAIYKKLQVKDGGRGGTYNSFNTRMTTWIMKTTQESLLAMKKTDFMS